MALVALTFDIDDTLWDNIPVMLSLEHHHYAHLTQLAQRALPFDPNGYAKRRKAFAAGLTDRRGDLTYIRRCVIYQLFLELNFSSQNAASMTEQAIEYMLSLRHAITPFDEAEPLLRNLSQRYRLASITNGNVDINRLSLGQYFDVTLKAGEIGMPKPHTEVFLHALAQLGQVLPEQAMHIGDSWVDDVQPSQALGMYSVWIQAHSETKQLSERLYQIAHIAQLPEILEKIDPSIRK